MATTLNTLQQDVAGVVDQTTTTPTQGGDEWNLRRSFINRSIEEFGHAFDWEVLRKTQMIGVTGVSQGSISLPGDFRKMARSPVLFTGGNEAREEFSEIVPERIGMYDTSDRYFYLLGDRGNGFKMIWNPATLASGVSLMVTYFAFPTSLTSPADAVVLSDPEFLINRTIAYIFEARSDSRFQGYETRARQNLLSMIENQQIQSRAMGENSYVKTRESLRWGFRLGRD